MSALLATILLVAAAAAAEPEYEMGEFQFVMFSRGAEQGPFGEREAQRRQERHVAVVQRLVDDGQAVLLGPIADRGDLREVLVLDVGSVDAARTLFADDPWVVSGRLELEVHPLWAAKGILNPVQGVEALTTCALGLFYRPEGAPDYDEDRLAELQRGHLANINEMAETGGLVWAGPFGDDGRLRGILVFRTAELERIRERVARDPSVKAGRLGVLLHRWQIPRGVLPPG